MCNLCVPYASTSWMKKTTYSLFVILLLATKPLLAQNSSDTTIRTLNLQQCIEFALRNQPAVRQAAIDEQINERDIRIGLSGWLPQLTSTAGYNYYFQRAVTGVGGTTGTGGTSGQQVAGVGKNVSTVALQASQTIYNNDVLLASRASKYSRLYYKESTEVSQIALTADVSKSFFDVLLSEKQLDIYNEDITRLQRSLKDSYTRYQAGVVDKTDYKQATINLNNSLAGRKQTQETIKSKVAYLKQVMGLTPEKQLSLIYDSAQFVKTATIDTNQILNIENRVEYRQLAAQKNLQALNVSYYKYGWLPSLSAVGSYSLLYFNDHFSDQYKNAYPTSLIGLSLNLPIFTGTKRLQNLAKARLQEDRVDLDIINTRNVINTEYVQALANYKSNYTNWLFLKQNVDLAKDVDTVVELQYREGIKTYLDVIVAQAGLRTAELSYYNALFTLLSSKIDLEKALGTLTVR